MSTIADIAALVIYDVENRTQDLAKAYKWVKDSINEITSCQEVREEFPELEVLGPLYNLTTGVAEYAEANIMPVGALNMATLNVRLWMDYPVNTRWRKLEWTSYQDADRYQSGQGATSSKAYRFGGNIGFSPPPDKPYQIQARVLKYHPWAAPLEDTVILLSQDWEYIIQQLADAIGFAGLEQYEKSTAIRQMLYGDPRHPENPGIIYGRTNRRKKENFRQEVSLRPVVRPYSHGGR
jgi:hypothetical protein